MFNFMNLIKQKHMAGFPAMTSALAVTPQHWPWQCQDLVLIMKTCPWLWLWWCWPC